MKFLIYMVALTNMISLFHLGAFLIGANVYDIRTLKRKHMRHTTKRKTRAYNPLVSVIVPAHNEENGILRTLDSLRESTYTNMEIIVVDDGSTDKTYQRVRRYAANSTKNPPVTYLGRDPRTGRFHRRSRRHVDNGTPITLLQQANAGKAYAVNNGIKNYAKGKLVMCLDADSQLDPAAIRNTVEYFRDRRIIGVAANVRVVGKGWLGMLQRFEHMIGYRSKKFYTMTNSEFIVGGVASTYRMSALKSVGYYDTDTQTEDIGLSMKLVAKLGNSKKRIVYAADVVALTEGVSTYGALMRQRYRWKLGCLQNLYKYRSLFFARGRGARKYSRMLTLYRLPVALLGEMLLSVEPILVAYVIYMSIHFKSPTLFVGAYLTITIYILWTIWPDEHMSVRQKLGMSFRAFVVYLLFFAMTVVQLVAIYRCLRNSRSITGARATPATWTSPARAPSTAR